MTKDTRHRTTFGNRFRLLLRFLGLTGAFAASIGAFVIFTAVLAFPRTVDAAWPFLKNTIQPALQGASGTGQQIAALALVLGLAAAAIWLAGEFLGMLFLVTGRRTMAGTSATLQIVLALVLIIAVNVYSFSHYWHLDLTRNQEFTLPAAVASELRTLNAESPTTIVVLQKHQTFATLAGKQDSFDTAADAKVVEKVRDLIDQFRELGGRFQIVVLDVNDKRFDQKLAEETKEKPKLREAIQAAPESSIFFASGDRIQRLSFSDFLQLDKVGSREANAGRGNLVLRQQGLEGFANRVFAIQEKRPKAAILVSSKILSSEFTEGLEAVTLAGLKKSLDSHGFDVEEIFIRKEPVGRENTGQPAADSPDENRLTSLESRRDAMQAQVDVGRVRIKAAEDAQKQAIAIESQSEDAQLRFWLGVYTNFLRDRLVVDQGFVAIESDPAVRKKDLADRIKTMRSSLDRLEKSLADTRLELVGLETNERAIEEQKKTDIKAKLQQKLQDVNLLIVPRITIISAPSLFGFEPAMHQLSNEQASVVKDFMKSGKPVLACLGPISGMQGPDLQAIDGFEKLLADRGVEVGKQTVLYNSEAPAYEEIRGKPFAQFSPHAADIPPLKFEARTVGDKRKPNPLGDGVRLSERSVGQPFDLRLRHPRPVTVTPEGLAKSSFAADFLFTPQESWNEASPYPNIQRNAGGVPVVTGVPEFKPVTIDENKSGSADDERAGPFSVGVAIESDLPKFWFDPNDVVKDVASLVLAGTTAQRLTLAAVLNEEMNATETPKSRLVVLGHGGVFAGPDLKPANEKLLLHSVNWLLGRSDRLPRSEAEAWEYPRVNLSERQFALWRWGAILGLPTIAIYSGIIVLMLRKVR